MQALKSLPDFGDLTQLDIGHIVDKTLKSMLRDFLLDYDMKPGEDFIDNLRDNEPSADFVVCSERANLLVKALMENRVSVVREHTRISKTGREYTVQAHFRVKN